MIAYLDTSSLVKLYIEEEGADHVRDLVSAAQLVSTSDVAYPEMRAALARRRRDGSLSPPDFRDARRALDADWSRYLAVAVTPELCREAGDLAERHRLRGVDSLHRASSLEVLRTAGASDVRFSSSDAALSRAAATVRRSRRRMLGSRP